MTKLMVASGFSQKSVEVVNLDYTNPDLICNNIPDLPFVLYGATGQLYKGSTPIICGGFVSLFQCECHQFLNGAWSPISSLNECKTHLKSAVLTNPISEDNNELLIVTGGYTFEEATLSTVESFDGQTWSKEMFANYPEVIHGHCLVKVDSTLLMSIGGVNTGYYPDSTANTYFFNILDNKWTPGPQLRIPRVHHSCGIMNWKNLETGIPEKVVVVAGGADQSSSRLNSVELLFLDDVLSGWTTGPNLPKTAEASTMVEFQDGVILIGGLGEVDGNHMYQLSSPTGTWTEMNQTLKQKRYWHVSFLVPDEMVSCH